MTADLEGTFVAHTPNSDGVWDGLPAHLRRTAQLAGEFGKAIGAEELAYTIGLWHDLGKFTPEFQHYIRAVAERKPAPRAPHSMLGARFSYELLTRLHLTWQEIVLPIAGHHSGLADSVSLEQELLHDAPSTEARVNAMRERVNQFALVPRSVTRLQNELLIRNGNARREMFIRMLLSVLRDADWLATEAHFSHDTAAVRSAWPDLGDLAIRLSSAHQLRFKEAPRTEVNRIRTAVHEACSKAAPGPQGIYRLTVPTGGGKTLSGLTFALDHARTHGLRRVIVALPYTSIIDQTAREYEQILGKEAVLEHHSQIEPPPDESEDPDAIRRRLATENWDAPVIVTTTVQLFESLLGRHPSRVRKIHNIAESVLVLDEVQTLPPELLAPITDVLRTLVEDYRVTLVLSTATQPAFDGVPGLRELGGEELVPQHREHFAQLRRVRYDTLPEPVSWKQLSEIVSHEAQTMVIMNTRRDAVRLLEALPEERRASAFHLSTLLCGTHRRRVLDEIRLRLRSRTPVLLISTQVVEAGVDISFPAVFRAFGPLDRIVQAAGRCNREGEVPGGGRVVIFDPAEGGTPKGPYKVGTEKARLLLRENPPDSLHDPALYCEYFRRLYSDVNLDRYRIQSSRERFDYPKVAQEFRMIREDTVPVVVPWEDSPKRLEEWREKPNRQTWQKLQPYIVSIHDGERRRFQGTLLEQVTEGLYWWRGQYDERLGLKEVMRDPSDLFVMAPEDFVV